MQYRRIYVWILVVFVIGGLWILGESETDLEVDLGNENGEVVRDVELQVDFTGAKVSEGDIVQGCLGKDCIPSIDDPKFVSSDEASGWLKAEDRVFAIDFNGVTRAYPQKILNWHEIVNDWYKEIPVVVTFCPLCGSALAFERKVDGVVTEFGVSGKLHNNDLIMYDRYEGNLWQQITGEAIVGPGARRDEVLKQISIITVPWQQWVEEHPETEVLAIDTGYNRDYNQYPYGTYEEDDRLLFGIKDLDRSLQIKTVVYGVELESENKTDEKIAKAYPEDVFKEKSVIIDMVGGEKIRLEKLESGQVRVTNLNSGEEIIPVRLFWFAWAAFHPETELYGID